MYKHKIIIPSFCSVFKKVFSDWYKITYMWFGGEESGWYPGYGAGAAPEAQAKENLLGINRPGQQQRINAAVIQRTVSWDFLFKFDTIEVIKIYLEVETCECSLLSEAAVSECTNGFLWQKVDENSTCKKTSLNKDSWQLSWPRFFKSHRSTGTIKCIMTDTV